MPITTAPKQTTNVTFFGGEFNNENGESPIIIDCRAFTQLYEVTIHPSKINSFGFESEIVIDCRAYWKFAFVAWFFDGKNGDAVFKIDSIGVTLETNESGIKERLWPWITGNDTILEITCKIN